MTTAKSTHTTETTDAAARDALAFACEVARRVAEQRMEDVILLDLRGLSPVADYFVLGTGTSDRQMHSVLDAVQEYASTIGRRPFRVADSSESSWILADYVDVMVHLFDQRHRVYYDLDSLWGDAARIDWSVPVGDSDSAG